MFEFKKILQNLTTNWITQCNAPLQRSRDLPLKRLQEKTANNKISENRNFTLETQYLNLKAPSTNVKMQSDKTLTTQI